MNFAGIVTVISTKFDSLSRLSVKSLFRGKLIAGKGDVRTPVEASPYGVDSNPIEGKKALYVRTGVDGKYYVTGYLNTDRKAEVGAVRLFATDAEGNFMFNIWIRANGEVLIGDSDVPGDYTNFATKYNELKVEYDKTKAYTLALKNATGAMAIALDALIPGTSTAFNTAMSGQVLGDIASCKHEKVKYKT